MSATSFKARWRRAPLAFLATLAISEAIAFFGHVGAFAERRDWSSLGWSLFDLALMVYFADEHSRLSHKVAELEANEKRQKMTARLLYQLRHPEPESRP